MRRTASPVPVQVFAAGGLPSQYDGKNTIIVGSLLSNIHEHLLPDPSVNLGPLVLVGGKGYDTVVLDDSAESEDVSGIMEAFMDTRPGGAVEDGKVRDHGMSILVYPPYSPALDAVQFNDFDLVHVKH